MNSRAHNMCKSGLDPIDCKSSYNCFQEDQLTGNKIYLVGDIYHAVLSLVGMTNYKIDHTI